MFEYVATVTRIIDGDTLIAEVDLGCRVHATLRLRLAGINAPELSTPDGVTAKGALTGLLAKVADMTRPELIIQTEMDKQEKYGRWLATLFVGHLNVNAEMVRLGHAVSYDGGKR